MELELGLALPNQQTPMMQQAIKAQLDLNCTYNINDTDLQMENSNKDASYYNNNQKNRHYFEDHITGDDEEEVESSNKGLSLLLWSGQQPNEDKWRNPHFNQQDMNVEEEDGEILGWPPINSLRKELIFQRQHQHHHHHLHNMVMQGHNDDQRRRMMMRVGSVGVGLRNYMSKYVKVKMEGVPIGRKIDLTLYNSYQDLTHTLVYRMFAKYCAGNDSKHGDYTILYQDKQGDWMLAADIPWETFVESVQRMEILRNVE